MDDLDLVEQYFLRELTEDEKKALDELIERSPEATRLFQERAGTFSPPQGLPELKLPPSPPPPKSGPISLSKWLWVLAGYGLLAAAFWLRSRNNDLHWPWDQPEQASLSSPAVSPIIPGTDNDAALAMGVEPTPEDEENGAVTPVPVKAFSPSNPAGNPGLRIVVERPLPARVTVTVLDPTGKEIRRLYDGALQAGRWAIDWDGRLADGSRAAIGAYSLQVRSGSMVQKQEVWVGQ